MTREDPESIDPRQMTARARRNGVVAAFACGVLVLTGCSSSPKPVPPTSVAGNVTASADINPSVSQRPSPLLLRVYELRTPTAFERADLMSLYQTDQAALGTDLVARDEFTVQPGEVRPYSKQLNPETRFIGIFAAYRNLEKARWRVVVPVVPAKAQKLNIRADALAVSAQVQP